MAEVPEPVSEFPTLPARPDTSHKGLNGRIAIVAGSRGMSGAAVLCGLGALRGGAGLVRVYTPASAQPIVAAGEPCYMTVPLAEDERGRLSPGGKGGLAAALLESAHDVLAIGPGLGVGDGVRACICPAICEFDGPVVLDADALNNIAADSPRLDLGRRPELHVLTPHPGELARLRRGAGMPELKGDDDETRLRLAHEYACYARANVVLKGHRTVVASPRQTYINTTGNAGMATGGMGDVLTGLIAALLGQGLGAFDSARLGVYVHGLAGNLCAQRVGPVGFLARDVADMIPIALAKAHVSRLGFR